MVRVAYGDDDGGGVSTHNIYKDMSSGRHRFGGFITQSVKIGRELGTCTTKCHKSASVRWVHAVHLAERSKAVASGAILWKWAGSIPLVDKKEDLLRDSHSFCIRAQSTTTVVDFLITFRTISWLFHQSLFFVLHLSPPSLFLFRISLLLTTLWMITRTWLISF